MKAIEIREQPVLSFARTVRITANGVRYRLFRSLVTVAVVAVAVAFLMNVLSESLIRRAIARRTARRIAELRLAAAWVARLTNPGTIAELLPELAAADARDPANVAQPPSAVAHEARQAVRYLDWFGGLDHARRRALVHTATGVAIFDHLQDRANLGRFRNALAAARSIRLPTSLADFEAFLAQWPKTKEQIESVRQGRAQAIASLARQLQGRSILEALTDAEGEFGEAARKAGFNLPPETAAEVARQARRMLDVRLVEQSLATPRMRQAIAAYLDVMPADVTVAELWRVLRTHSGAKWCLARDPELASKLTAERVVELARVQEELNALSRAERVTVASGGFTGSGERMDWLVIASMLVCVVGIANAMLMTVTERFREIATLKCLGALDGFIMLMFVLESCMLGVVGGLVGGLIGLIIGGGRMLAAFGRIGAEALPWPDLGLGLLAALVVGVFLAAVAAVYPSFRAARLAPMEAMRVE